MAERSDAIFYNNGIFKPLAFGMIKQYRLKAKYVRTWLASIPKKTQFA